MCETLIVACGGKACGVGGGWRGGSQTSVDPIRGPARAEQGQPPSSPAASRPMEAVGGEWAENTYQ